MRITLRKTKRAYEEFSGNYSAWQKAAHASYVFHRLDTYNLADELQKVIPPELLSGDEKTKIEGFKDQLARMFSECERKGGYTTEAANFQDQYVAKEKVGMAAKIKELLDVSVGND